MYQLLKSQINNNQMKKTRSPPPKAVVVVLQAGETIMPVGSVPPSPLDIPWNLSQIALIIKLASLRPLGGAAGDQAQLSYKCNQHEVAHRQITWQHQKETN